MGQPTPMETHVIRVVSKFRSSPPSVGMSPDAAAKSGRATLLAFSLFFLFISSPQTSSHLKQGLIALNHGDLQQARQELEQAGAQEPKNPYVWTSLAETYLRLGELDKAESAGSKAGALSATNPVAAHALSIFDFNYAQVLLRKQDFTHAADLLSKALETNPRDAQLRLALGVARYGQRRFEEAIGCFLEVIQIDPKIEQPYVFLGKMLDQAGPRLTEITKDVRNWMAQEPQNAEAPLVVAKALLVTDSRRAEAEELLRRSIKLDSKNWEAHYELGVLLANRHEYQKAATELERSIELNDKEAMPHYHLARVYDRLGEPDRARAEREIHEKLTGTTAH